MIMPSSKEKTGKIGDHVIQRKVNSVIMSSMSFATKWELAPWLVGIESMKHSADNVSAPSETVSTVTGHPPEKPELKRDYSTVSAMLNGELSDFLNSKGVRRLRFEVADLAERACLHQPFLSWSYMSRMLFSAAFVFIALYINAVASVAAGHRTPRTVILGLDGQPTGAATLPDLGHDLWAWALSRAGHGLEHIDFHALPDRMLAALGRLTLAFMALHPQRCRIFRRTAVVVGALSLARAATVTLTALPDASPTCQAQFAAAALGPGGAGAYKALPAFPRSLRRGWAFLRAPTAHVTCGDMVFSMHTTLFVLCALVVRRHLRPAALRTKALFRGWHVGPRLCAWGRRAAGLYALAGAALVVGTRLHYSLDVALAALLAWVAHEGYHALADHAPLRAGAPLVDWLEGERVRAVDEEAYRRAVRD